MTRRREVLALLGAAVVLAACAAVATAAPAADEATFGAWLQAGEFAPALAHARQAASPKARDALLRQIAVAQAQSGDRRAALRTASEITDDGSQSHAIAAVQAVPLGGVSNADSEDRSGGIGSQGSQGQGSKGHGSQGQGGSSMADFTELIGLITETVAKESWSDNGGNASIAQFPTGVMVDAQGVLRRLASSEGDPNLAALRAESESARGKSDDVRRASPMRKVSLPRLERAVRLRSAALRPPSDEMQALAGLQRIEYVLVYPESGDVVLAGPAGDWKTDGEERLIGVETGLPVVRLDDLVVVFRRALGAGDARFGCTITPRQESLASLQEYVAQWRGHALQPGQRRAWLEQLRAHVGLQDIQVFGLDPQTRAARVMVEADYRMKLVGMGLEEGVPGVKSYLASIRLAPGQSPPPMTVLRWWFTLNYDALSASSDRTAFALRGQGVQVLSENQWLAAEGKRVPTGQSDELNRQFAQSFTEHFGGLCVKYPVYAELRNLGDLALVGALLREERIPEKTGWRMTCFADPRAYRVPQAPAPTTVDTVINHRVVNGTTVLAGVSGGVAIDPTRWVSQRSASTESDALAGVQAKANPAAAPKSPARDAWWWD